MLGRLNHVAIAVKDAEKAARIYGAAFGADISAAVPLPEHGVITVFATLPNTKIEFIQPLGEASPIAKFLERNAEDRRARQAGTVSAPEGFFRRARGN
jgi:methylmalonyl-CoA/ethylmalonyl-CoA epimerase